MDKSLFSLNRSEKSKIKVAFIIILIAASAAIAVFYSANVASFFSKIQSILFPFIFGFVIAFILNKPCMKLTELIGKTSLARYKKALGILLSYLIFFSVISLFIVIVVPQLVDSSAVMINGISSFVANSGGLLSELEFLTQLDEEIIQTINAAWADLFSALGDIISNAIPALIGVISGATSALANTIIGTVVSVYILIEKEKLIAQINRFIRAFTAPVIGDKLISTGNHANEVFSKFIVGQLTVAGILGVVCFIAMTLLGMPYAMLISVIIAFTNIIPYFGPWIGSVPSVFILFTVNPRQAGIFIILILILQQIESNLISPKIVGGSIGLSGFWVLFAITIGGGFFGLPGMIVGTPTFAVIYGLFGELVEYRIAKKSANNTQVDINQS